ncbi:MAG: hypothetical protein RLZZ629_768, partial [Actinomycetota bacterium]
MKQNYSKECRLLTESRMKEGQEDSHASFFFKNLLKGLIWFAVIITAYILVQGELKVYEAQINKV